MLGHVIAYLVVITVSLLTAYAMGKPVEERRDKASESITEKKSVGKKAVATKAVPDREEAAPKKEAAQKRAAAKKTV